jgi:hypothetical protein
MHKSKTLTDSSGINPPDIFFPIYLLLLTLKMALITHTGSYHCGRVQFQVQAPEELNLFECTCKICSKKGYQHLTVPNSRFQLIQGADAVSLYTFNTGTAKHYFCRYCGISSYYIPRSNPDGVDVNFRCLDPGTVKSYTIVPFDGQNWEDQASLAHLSKESS